MEGAAHLLPVHLLPLRSPVQEVKLLPSLQSRERMKNRVRTMDRRHVAG